MRRAAQGLQIDLVSHANDAKTMADTIERNVSARVRSCPSACTCSARDAVGGSSDGMGRGGGSREESAFKAPVEGGDRDGEHCVRRGDVAAGSDGDA